MKLQKLASKTGPLLLALTVSLGAGLTPASSQSSAGGKAEDRCREKMVKLQGQGNSQFKNKNFAAGDASFRQALNEAKKLGKAESALALQRWAQATEFQRADLKRAELLYMEAVSLVRNEPKDAHLRAVQVLAQFYRRHNEADKADLQEQIAQQLQGGQSIERDPCPACGRG